MKPTLCLSALYAFLATAALAQDAALLLSSPRSTVIVGEAVTLRASLQGSITTTPVIVFSSSDPTIATVAANGSVSTLLPGQVTIQAQEQSTGAKTQLDIKIIPSRIIISPAVADIRVGDSLRLTASALDMAGNPISGVTFRFFSAEPEVADISADGVVQPVAAGVVTMTAEIASAPATFGFYASIELRVGPKREYALRRVLAADPAGVSTISALTNLTASGELVGGLATLSNGGQAAVVRESNGQLRTVVYAGQFLPNIGRLAVRIPAVSVNAKGDLLADIQYPDPWCTHGLVLFPRNGAEIELAVACNPYVSRHALTDDGSAFFFLDDSRGRHLRKRLQDGTTTTLLETAGQDPGPNGIRALYDYWPLRDRSAVLLRAQQNNGNVVTLWVTDKSSKIIFTNGDFVGSKTVNGYDEMHGASDGAFYSRCNGNGFEMICKVTAAGFQPLLTTNDVIGAGGVRLGWIHTVFDSSGGKVLFAGDWQVNGAYGSNLGMFDGTTVTLLNPLPAWNGVALAQMTASGTIFAKVTESDQVLSNLKAGSDPSPVIAKGTAFATAVSAIPDIVYQTRGATGSTVLAMGAGEQVISVDSNGVREVLSPLTPLPDGGRVISFGGLAANRNGQAAISVYATQSARVYKLADGKLTPLLTQNNPVASSDSNKYSWTWTGRGNYLSINAGGDVASYGSFGAFERLVFIPNGASQMKTVFTFRTPLPNGFALANLVNVAVDDTGKVLFISDILNGPRALFYWDGQQIKEVMRIGATVDGRVVDGINNVVGGAKGFTVYTTTPGVWRVHSFDGQKLSLMASGDQPVNGFSKTWGSLSNMINVAGNGDVHVFGSSSDGSGIFVLRPDGSSTSILRAGDVLPEGGFVIQPVGMFSGPNGEVSIAADILEGGKEKIAIYTATPLR